MMVFASIILSLVVAVIYVTELQIRRATRRKAMRDSVKAQFARARPPRRPSKHTPQTRHDEVYHEGAKWLDSMVREVESAARKDGWR